MISISGPGGHDPQSQKKIRMMRNGGPITGRLIHRITKYSGFHDAFVTFSFPVLLIRKGCHHSNRIKLDILQFCLWLQHTSSVDKTTKMSLFLMGNGYQGFKIIVAQLLDQDQIACCCYYFLGITPEGGELTMISFSIVFFSLTFL